MLKNILPQDDSQEMMRELGSFIARRPTSVMPVRHLPRQLILVQTPGAHLVQICAAVIPEHGPYVVTRGYTFDEVQLLARQGQMPMGVTQGIILPPVLHYGTYLHHEERFVTDRDVWRVLTREMRGGQYIQLGVLTKQSMVTVQPEELVPNFDERMAALDAPGRREAVFSSFFA